MTVRELRNMLFSVGNQELTVKELRAILFEVVEQDEELTCENMFNLTRENVKEEKVKKIVFTEGFWYDDIMFVEAGEYDYIPARCYAFDEVLIKGEWYPFAALEDLEYYVKD